MKIIYRLLLTGVLLCPAKMESAIVQTDPLLTAAIIAQSEMLKEQYEQRSKHHTTIEACQAAITVSLDYIHNVEEEMLEYMANASGVIQNMYQLKQIAELAAVDIPNNLVQLGKSVPDNIKGTAITLFVNKTITDTQADVIALSEIITRLVTSQYSFKDSKDDKNVNLLSAAERYSILQSVHFQLNRINRRLLVTGYCLKTFGWIQLWRGLDREGWCNVMYGKMLTKDLVRRWNQL